MKTRRTVLQRFGLGETVVPGRPSLAPEQSGDELDIELDEDGSDCSRHTRPTRLCPAAAGLPDVGDVVGGHYHLVEQLGEGMFGRVYLAERTDVPEHRVALKVITRAVYAGRNVERELVMLAAASHPHIVQLKDHGVADEYVWLTMPLYEGETLADRLERGPLGLREAYEIFVPIARGVETLHDRGLRHQDVKPENVFLARFADRLHPVLLDLGVAVETTSDFVAGTVLYGSPEQVAAIAGIASTLDEKIDCYCLASTLLRALAGPEHFPGEDVRTPYDLAAAFETRATAPLHPGALPELAGDARAQLAAAFARWLAREPSERPSAGVLALELEVLLEQEREAARRMASGVERQKRALRHVRAAAGAMLLAGVGAALFGFSKRETLRLAGELERARAAGRASFVELDTCTAEYDLVTREAQACSAEREQAAIDHQRELAAAGVASDETESAFERRLLIASGRLRTCEDDARAAASAWSDERGALVSSFAAQEQAWQERERGWADERQSLAAARDELSRGKRSCDSDLASTRDGRDECRADLASCIDDRDTCLSAASDEPPAPAAQAPEPPAPAPVPATQPAG